MSAPTTSVRTRGAVLRELRLGRKQPNGKSITQSQLARAIGVEVQSVSMWENDKVDVSPENLRKLIDFYGVKPEALGYEVPEIVAKASTLDDQRWEQLDARLRAIENKQAEILREVRKKR